jgi:hypothetical protein
MSQRESGYERKERDLYETPEWVTEALLPYLPGGLKTIWEPACGPGKMVRVLRAAYPAAEVLASDVDPGDGHTTADFLAENSHIAHFPIDAIVTNPPYAQAEQFIVRALDLAKAGLGVAAMLLRVDFDSAKSRRYLFADHHAWSKKIVLVDRIRWFKGESSPSFNHAWFMWDWKHEGPPTIAYASRQILTRAA